MKKVCNGKTIACAVIVLHWRDLELEFRFCTSWAYMIAELWNEQACTVQLRNIDNSPLILFCETDVLRNQRKGFDKILKSLQGSLGTLRNVFSIAAVWCQARFSLMCSLPKIMPSRKALVSLRGRRYGRHMMGSEG